MCDNQSFKSKIDDDVVTGSFSAGWEFQELKNLYASYSRGYKSGGINLNQDAVGTLDPITGLYIDASVFDPELVDAYEIGLKSEWMDRKITANFAAFYQEVEDYQLNTFNGVSLEISNLPKVKTQGVEFDGNWVAHDWATITGGLSYVTI